MFNLLEFIGYKLYSALSVILPLRFAYGLADLVGYLFFKFTNKDSKIRARIMQKIFKDEIGFNHAYKLVRKNTQLFNRGLVDFFRSGKLNKYNIDSFVEFYGIEHLENALKKGKGAVLASIHIGNWEMSGIGIAIKGFPVYGLVWDGRNRWVDNLLKRIRSEKGVGTARSSSLKRVLELLQKNKIIGIMLDVDGGEKGIQYPLWGHNVRLPRGPAAISLDTGAELLILSALKKKDGGYKLYIEKPKVEGTEEEITIGTFEILKKYIENNPIQWHWIKYFFELQPLEGRKLL